LVEEGQDKLNADPVRAIELSRDSRELNDEALDAYYLEAAAMARLGSYAGARSALREAARREPGNFVTWGLIGDLAARRGDLAGARRAYRRASELNPRDEKLAELASSRAAVRRVARQSERDEGRG
jgi:Flp pilus assembly protein TadD